VIYHKNNGNRFFPSLAKSSANGLDLTLSATKTASPLALISVLKFVKGFEDLLRA
jgi:hypothetical protein